MIIHCQLVKALFPKVQLKAIRGLDCREEDPRSDACDHNSKGIPQIAFNEDSE